MCMYVTIQDDDGEYVFSSLNKALDINKTLDINKIHAYPVGPVRTVISPRRNPLMREVKPGRLGIAAKKEQIHKLELELE